jgi:DNA-binding SARP family transcriptional activator
LFSIERWQGRWRNISLIFKGEIKLHWEDVNAGSGNKHSSFWGNILKIFRGERKSKETAAKIIEVESESEFIDPAPTQISNEHSDTSIDPLVIEQNPVQEPDKKPASTDQELTTITVSVQMLGFFNMSIQDVDIKLPSSRSLLLLKYLILNHKQNTPRDVLMEMFWPDLEPEKARNNLNVAIYTLRKNLREYTDFPIIHYEDSAYGVVNEVQIWLDVDEFELLVKVGRQLEARDEMSKAVSKYEAAISLYQGDFLEDNPYEGWTALTRERLRMAYLDTLDRLNQIYYNQQHYAMCITLSQLILTRDRCREDAHFMLMRCYSHQGQDHLALRQYQVCEDALRLELDVIPSPETLQLFEQIRQHKEI